MRPVRVYVGSYTERLGHCLEGSGAGISTFELDASGRAGAVSVVAAASTADPTAEVRVPANPSYVAFSPPDAVYAVCENEAGALVAFGAGADGRLRARAAPVSTCGAAPCHLAACARGVAVANYGGGSVAVMRHGDEGMSLVAHSGRGPNAERQEASHCHGVEFTCAAGAGACGCGDDAAAGQRQCELLVADLGTDCVHLYAVDWGAAPARVVVRERQRARLRGGAGPRHVRILRRRGARLAALVVNELDCTVSVLEFVRGAAQASVAHTTSILPPSLTAALARCAPGSLTLTAGALRVDAAQRWAFVSVRASGDAAGAQRLDSIVTLELSGRDGGSLSPRVAAHTWARGACPRALALAGGDDVELLDADGDAPVCDTRAAQAAAASAAPRAPLFLLCALQDAHRIAVFRVDADSGALTHVEQPGGADVPVRSPTSCSCVAQPMPVMPAPAGGD